MLSLALVGILVAAEGLRCREVAAAVVALELGTALATAAISVAVALGVFGGIFFGVGLMGDLDAKEADGGGGLLTGGRRTDEWELGEGVDAHEVVGLSLAHLCH